MQPNILEPIELPIEKLRIDGGTQPRSHLDESHIEDLIRAIEEDATLDAADAFFDGSNYWLADGFHRRESLVRCGVKTISVVVRQGTLQDAQWHSYSANQHRALKRNNADKNRSVMSALKHAYGVDKSNVAIASHCGVDERLVRKLRGQLEASGEIPKTEYRETTRNGTTYLQKVEKATPACPQKFRVSAPGVPYDGETVEVVNIKSGDCYECKLPDGKVYPFFKNELVDVNNKEASVSRSQTKTVTFEAGLTVAVTPRQRIIKIIMKLPEDKLEEAEALLCQKYKDILS